MSAIRGYLPTLKRSHMLVREFTLIVFIIFTTLSLAIFWSEQAAANDIPSESVQAIGWVLNGIIAGLFAWVTLWTARVVAGSGGGQNAAQ